MSINSKNKKNNRTANLLRSTVSTSLLVALAAPTPLFAKDAPKKATSLSTVVVKESALPNPGDVKGYKTGTSRSSTRTETPLIDVPQSISVVTQDQIQDQHITSMAEAIRYVPGIVTHQGEGNRDQLTIRGNNTTADFFIDGARDDAQYFRDFYNIDRIEILKGPNALAFGRGGSGGLVNRISKTADGVPVRQVIVSGGSYEHKRLQTDVGGEVSDRFALRFNGMAEDSGTFRQFGDLQRQGLNPTGAFRLSENTRIETGYEYFHEDRFNDRGVPSFSGRPYHTDPETFFGDPTQNRADATVHTGYAILTHDFAPDLQLRNYTRYTDNTKFYQNTFPGGAVNGAGSVSITGYNNDVQRQSFTNQTDLTKKFETGSLRHTALAGMEITRQDTQTFRNTAFFNNVTTSVTVPASNPISTTPITYRQSATDADNNTLVNVYGAYVQDQVDINKYVQVIGGLRYDSFDVDFHDNRTAANRSRSDNLWSPRFGVVLKPQDNLSFYTSYSSSYLPSSGDQFGSLTAQAQGLKPEHLENYEIGSKWDITSAFNVSAAIYQLNRSNTRAPHPTDPTLVVATGESRTRGVELTATGQVTDRWQIIGGYAFQDAEITTTTSDAAKGKKVGLVPKHMASLWNKYDFTPEWGAAIGVIHQSDQFAAVDNTVKLKGYTRLDGAVYYRITPDYRVQVNVENILDREYIQTAHNNNNISPGSPIAVRASLIANF